MQRLDGVMELRVLDMLEVLPDLRILCELIPFLFEDVEHLLHPIQECTKREGALTLIMKTFTQLFICHDPPACISLALIMVVECLHVTPSIDTGMRSFIHCSTDSATRKLINN